MERFYIDDENRAYYKGAKATFHTVKGIKYKPVLYQDAMVLNSDLSVTLDSAVYSLEKFFKTLTETFLRQSLVELEIPQRSATQQRINTSMKELVDKALFPRGVLTYTYNPSQESLVHFASSERMNGLPNSMRVPLLTIRDRVKDSNTSYPNDNGPNITQSIYKDIDFTIYGSPKYHTMQVAYSVLLSTEMQAFDLSKLLKLQFPEGELINVFENFRRGYVNQEALETAKHKYETNQITEEEYKDEVLKATKYMDDQFKRPSELKVKIPNELVNMIKETFDYNEDILIDKMNLFSKFYKTEKEIDGANREFMYSISYPAPIYLKLESIDSAPYEKEGNITTYVVRMEMTVNYIEFIAFRPSGSYQILNIYNDDNKVNTDSTDGNAVVKIPICDYYNRMGHKTLYMRVKVEFSEDDYDETLGVVSCYLLDILPDAEMHEYINKYRRENYDVGIKTNPPNFPYYDIQMKDTHYVDDIPIEDQVVYGSEEGFNYDYDTHVITYSKGKPGTIIEVALYINNSFYHKHLTNMKYTRKNNLSSTVMYNKNE